MRKIKKVTELLARVMTLNKNAPNEVYYCFEFHGHTNQVNFIKCNKSTYDVIFDMYAYLNKDNLGHPLSNVEKAIEKEEKLCKGMTKI